MSCVGRGALVAGVFFLMTEHTTVGLAQESTGPEAAPPYPCSCQPRVGFADPFSLHGA